MVTKPNIIDHLRKCALFDSIDDKALQDLSLLFEEIRLPANSFILNEGDAPENFLILSNGEAEIIKKDKINKTFHRIALIHKKEIIGELSLLDNHPRSASVRSLTPVKILTIPFTTLRKFLDEHQNAKAKLYFNLAHTTNTRLKTLNETTLKTLQYQIDTARFMEIMTLLTFVYVFLLQFTSYLISSVSSATFVSVPLLIFFLAWTILGMWYSNLPISTYGLTLKKAGHSAMEAIIFTIPVLLSLILFKLILMKYLYSFSDQPLFVISSGYTSGDNFSFLSLLMVWLLYAVGIPIQELISRGAFQGSLHVFLSGRYRNVMAIFMSSMQFSFMHLPISGLLAAAVFPLGIFWGWLFYRSKSLVGVTLSHIIIGIMAMNFLGLNKLFF